jgi:FkbM family methyltransferase
VPLHFPASESAIQTYELNEIVIGDCYGLRRLRGKVSTVLDVGANVGLFSIAARHSFRDAAIHAYEPNPGMEPYLRAHCSKLGVECFMEAVGDREGMVALETTTDSLHGRTEITTGDGIVQVSLQRAIERLGGRVDLVKLDCEGAEWTLLSNIDRWKDVTYLRMEYHLWAAPGKTIDDLLCLIDRIGFECTNVKPAADGTYGFLEAVNRLSERASSELKASLSKSRGQIAAPSYVRRNEISECTMTARLVTS